MAFSLVLGPLVWVYPMIISGIFFILAIIFGLGAREALVISFSASIVSLLFVMIFGDAIFDRIAKGK